MQPLAGCIRLLVNTSERRIFAPMRFNRLLMAVAVLALLATTTACKSGKFAERRKMTKYSKGTLSQRDSAAYYYYGRKNYDLASLLFEELLTVYRTDPRREKVLYHLAYSNYQTKMYGTAAEYFQQYTQQFPNGEFAEECAYMVAESFYKQSDPWYLDQSYTKKAIEQTQLFLGMYPRSEKTEAGKLLLEKLYDKLIRKDFEQAKLYYNVGYFKAAVQSFQNLNQDYPDSKYREEATYLMLVSQEKLADMSVSSKQKNRYLDALDFYKEFKKRYPNSKFSRDAEAVEARVKKMLDKLDSSR